jgi:hypothetical protein
MNELDILEVLEIAIAHERGVGRLATELGAKQNVVSAWRMRKIIHPGWALGLRLKYKKQIKQAIDDRSRKTTGVAVNNSGVTHE